MISIRIMPEDQRLAAVSEQGGLRLIGPGIVLVRRRPGERIVPLSIGDRGELAARDKATFRAAGDARLPVELKGTGKAGTVRIVGFDGAAIIVAPGEPPAQEEQRTAGQQTGKPRFSARAFWVGLPVIVLLAAACWMGAMHAEDQVITERAVYERGVVTAGTVVKKILYHQTYPGEQTHYISYSFRTPEGGTFRKEIRIDPAQWNALQGGGPITVRYVPGHPERNLPDGWHMASYYYLVGGLAFGGALSFSVIAAGMLIKKLTGGYRGEADPFLGRR